MLLSGFNLSSRKGPDGLDMISTPSRGQIWALQTNANACQKGILHADGTIICMKGAQILKMITVPAERYVWRLELKHIWQGNS